MFRYYGFEGDVPEDGSPFVLHKGSLKVEISPLPGAGEFSEGELGSLLLRETKADRRIVVSLGRFSPGARKLGEEKRVQLWDRARLEEEAGRMLLAEVDTRQASGADESLLEPFLRGSMSELGAESAEEGQAGDARQAEGPLPDVELFDGEGMVPPKILQEPARRLVSERLEGAFRFDLRMTPHFCYAYACPIERGHGVPDIRRGLLLVNAIGGEVLPWEPVGLTRWDGTAVRMEPSIEPGLALEKAREWVISSNTRVVHLKHDRGSVTVYEKVTLKPSAAALRLEYRGLVFLPVWGIEGGNGAVVLDALDGRVLKEELFTAVAKTNENPVSDIGTSAR